MSTLLGGKPVTVGIDGSDRAIVAARWAASAAAHRHAPMRLLHATGYTEAVAGTLPPAQRLWEQLQRTGDDALELAFRAVREVADVQVEKVLVDDPPARALLKAAQDSRMLVVGGSGHPGGRNATRWWSAWTAAGCRRMRSPWRSRKRHCAQRR